jgi:methionine-rich copper-binding protein CopC
MKKLFVLLFVLLGVALAHSKPVKIVPANGATVVAPKTVSIVFDEGIEGNFSTFKVYGYTGEVNNTAIRAFARAKLPLKNDSAARADSGNDAKGGTKTVNIALKPKLAKGVYVVMWRILGEDTHTVDSWSFFRVK